MGRLPTLPKLSQLDVRQVALSATRADLEHLANETASLYGSSARLALRGENLSDNSVETFPAARALRKLGEYAQVGRALDPALEPLLTRLLPLLRRALDIPIVSVDQLPSMLDSLGEATPLGVLLCAAWARAQLGRDAPLTAMQLAALGSSSRRTIINLIDAGTLRGARRASSAQKRNNPYLVPAKDARLYLSAQEVPGISPKSTRATPPRRGAPR
jgi:hypothetical protein